MLDAIHSLNKERSMNYSKPEIYTLGNAKAVIEQINPQKPPTSLIDNPFKPGVPPAYDLDE